MPEGDTKFTCLLVQILTHTYIYEARRDLPLAYWYKGTCILVHLSTNTDTHIFVQRAAIFRESDLRARHQIELQRVAMEEQVTYADVC